MKVIFYNKQGNEIERADVNSEALIVSENELKEALLAITSAKKNKEA